MLAVVSVAPNSRVLCKGMMSAAASLGLSLLWETEVGISHVDKYTYSAEEHIKVLFQFWVFLIQ